ncbi:S9 family peptidase [Sphingosinicella rhizophila]|uniref:Acyl-peptide hydrolase n=1 Tax=Sphingosinicella rhizophila TaxID=3050082 RepID=A0ABU3QAP8_9SPHN|nr:prolyl oligopeptidase family serine peptidase [Sphingosinicella sp. GR2756]MDT9600476.1 prolyl oligopeptidase family serine peptidase [Sphingosinicella sp. GR2756]
MASRFAYLLAAAGAALALSPALAASPQDADFLKFPLATNVSAAEVPAFAWLVQQGDDRIIMFARGPAFKPVRLFTRTDVDGQPISDVRLSPDGSFVLFRTALPYAGGKAYNPAGLVEPPQPIWWILETRAGAKPAQLDISGSPTFSPDGKKLLYRQQRDLWAIDLGAAPGEPKLLAKGAGAFGGAVWTRDGKGFYFVQDRGGYAFLGHYRLGAPQVEWLVTGPDRLASPVLSPDEKTIAFLRFPGRQNDVTYDYTESEPFAVDTVDLASGTVRNLWETRERAVLSGLEDGDNALRWVGNDRIVFYSEHDGFGRLYAVPRTGGEISALTPARCEAAESEPAGPDMLLVVHNCRDIDTRQLSLVNVRTGQEKPLASKDIVMANAMAIAGSPYIAFVGGNAEEAPLLRVLDTRTGQLALAEKAADYGYRYSYTGLAPKAVRFKAADGGTVPGQLFLPATPGPHPALVYVHGGPPRQMYPAFHYSDYYAADYAMNRRLAELGYVVLSVNYRSGIGYGRAFREAPKRGWRGASEYQDVLGAGRWLAARDDVDRKRIGIWGGSYGGLLTGQALARDSDLFSAGVAVHGVFDWSWPSDRPGHLNPSVFFGVSEDDRALARKSSPIGAIDGWRSPVLLFSGDEDMNVDVRETVDLAQKLKARNVDVRTVLIPGEGHGFARNQTYRRLWQEQQRFFEEKLDGK